MRRFRRIFFVLALIALALWWFLPSPGLRVAAGRTQVLDGPYVDSKEQLGGYFLIDVADLDGAISWAARCPAAGHGIVEVRPLWTA